MLLTALDVPEETIMKDYMASNNHIDLRSLAYMARNLNTDAQETITVLLGANETWLDLAFHKIKKEYGSTDKYLSKGLHLTEKERDKLKDIILNYPVSKLFAYLCPHSEFIIYTYITF